MAMKTTIWDVSEHLDGPEAIAGYLEAVFADAAPSLIAAALGDVARAMGMTEKGRGYPGGAVSGAVAHG